MIRGVRNAKPATQYRERGLNSQGGEFDPLVDESDLARSRWGLSRTKTCNHRKWPEGDLGAPGRVGEAPAHTRIVGSSSEWIPGVGGGGDGDQDAYSRASLLVGASLPHH
jgi:hypothetical protein